MKQRICFEVQNLIPTGFYITIKTHKRIPFEKLNEYMCVNNILEVICIIKNININACKLITEEEYDEKYGG